MGCGFPCEPDSSGSVIKFICLFMGMQIGKKAIIVMIITAKG